MYRKAVIKNVILHTTRSIFFHGIVPFLRKCALPSKPPPIIITSNIPYIPKLLLNKLLNKAPTQKIKKIVETSIAIIIAFLRLCTKIPYPKNTIIKGKIGMVAIAENVYPIISHISCNDSLLIIQDEMLLLIVLMMY